MNFSGYRFANSDLVSAVKDILILGLVIGLAVALISCVSSSPPEVQQLHSQATEAGDAMGAAAMQAVGALNTDTEDEAAAKQEALEQLGRVHRLYLDAMTELAVFHASGGLNRDETRSTLQDLREVLK